ncbi:hypothetical protein WM457_02986 (plasmid) [Clavibacter nebraskensis]
MLARAAAIVTTGLLALFLATFSVSSAAFADSCTSDPFGPRCDITIPGTGTPAPTPGAGGGDNGSPIGFTPGPQTCKFGDAEVPCSTADGAYSTTNNCTGYIKLDDPQDAPPPGKSAAVGAWYKCTPYCPPDLGEGCFGATFWSDTPPAGVVQYTPAQAAAALVKTFQLRGIDIGMAPESKVHSDDPANTAPYRRTWVGIPVWLWVNNPAPLSYGPYTETGTLGGTTVTATAKVSSVTWKSGDGQSVTCGTGTPFNLAAMKDQLAQDSPTCGFRFQKTSGSGEFTVTATSHWTVTWTGGGTSGQIAVRDTSSSANVRVGELQSVNTNTVDPFG